MRCCCFLPIIWSLNAVILLVLNTSVQCDVDVSLSTAEYYRLTGNWSLGGITLLKNGTPTKERLLIPECVHTITMKWHSLQQLQYTSAKLQSGKPGVLPIVLTSVPQKGLLPVLTDTISLEFRCNGSGDARVDVSIAVSNHDDNIIHHVFSLNKRCGNCHNSSGIPGGPCEHLLCINGGRCVSYNHSEVCICPSGYYGKHCEHAWCHPYCENGGNCIKPDKCQCPRRFAGNQCNIAICQPRCLNGGKCVGDGVCHCVRPYYGPRCKQKGYIKFIHKPKRRINVQQSNTTIITCKVMGAPAVEITWLKNGRKMSRDVHHYSILHKYSNHTVTSTLQIYNTMATDMGQYTCFASNSIMSNEKHSYIRVKQFGIGMCDDPPIPSNGDVVSNGTVVTYACEEGFTLVGNRQRFCDKTTDMWNGSDPTCEGFNHTAITLIFENPAYNVTELKGKVEVCLLSSHKNEVPVTVVVQPEEVGSAEEPDDFTLTSSTVTFGGGQQRACYNQSVVNDELPEPFIESFVVRIMDNPNITVGTPAVSQINIIDDDGRLIMRNDTILGDPLYTVPLQISDELIEANPDVANVSLCYEVHGSSGSIYNLVSDTCVSINAEYIQGNTSDINIVGRIGVLAVANNGVCQRITIDVKQCTGTVGSIEVAQGSPYDSAGIRVRKGRRYFRIAVPNCERQDLVSWVICEQGDMLKFVITRGFNLQPTSHGLIGQFWNIPVELDEFTGTTPDSLTYYTITVTPPDGDIRSFVGHLYDVTWDFTPVPCVYPGNRNGGPVFEFDNPNDSVIEGNYTLYEVSDLFSTGFTYEQFDEARCN